MTRARLRRPDIDTADATGAARAERTPANNLADGGWSAGWANATMVQAKLTVGAADDPFEREADLMASSVMRNLQRPASGAEPGDDWELLLQRSVQPSPVRRISRLADGSVSAPTAPVIGPEGGALDASTGNAIERAKGHGNPLDEGVRKAMEPSFGADFSGVRVHTDARSDSLNQAIQAKAFTTGSDIFFRGGAYSPSTAGGQHLLAHELTHVVQQGGAGGVRRMVQTQISREGEDGAVAVAPAEQAPAPASEAPAPAASPLAQILHEGAPAIAAIDSRGPRPRHILKNVLFENWKYAKSQLAKHAAGVDTAAEDALMLKLWEFRQWHYADILKQVQAALGGKEALDFAAAGSSSPTSDIDVNMTGTKTEAALPLFNKKFAADGWTNASGVVYDVNVYAYDHLWGKKGSIGVDEPGLSFGAVKERVAGGEENLSVKEGGRTGATSGGLTSEAILVQDIKDQTIWSLVHLRRFMTPAEWTGYKTETDPQNKRAAEFSEAELRFTAWQQACVVQMYKDAGQVLGEAGAAGELAATGDAGGEAQLEHVAHGLVGGEGPAAQGATDNALISASNTIYGEKMAAIAGIRKLLKARLKRYEQLRAGPTPAKADSVEMEINEELRDLRKLVSEAIMYANEVYVTDAAINHAVVGSQIGMGISLTKAESMQVVTENLGDCYKIFGHAGSMLAAAADGGKYLFRLGDAASNMGYDSIPGVLPLRQAGYEISSRLKNSLDPDAGLDDAAKKNTEDYDDKGRKIMTGDKNVQIYASLTTHLGIARPALDGPAGVQTLKDYTMRVAAAVTKAYERDKKVAAQKLAKPVRTEGNL